MIRSIDGPVFLTSCLTDHNDCGLTGRCNVCEPLRKVHEEILRLLQSISIADMCEGESPWTAALAAIRLILSSRFCQGSGDKQIQTYCFRLCMNHRKSQRVPVKKPRDYNERDHELLLRYAVQDVPYEKLEQRLLADKQILR